MDTVASFLELGSRVREARSARRLSPDDLAERAGMGTADLTGIEEGTLCPTALGLQRIARELGLSLADLLAHRHLPDGPFDARIAVEALGRDAELLHSFGFLPAPGFAPHPVRTAADARDLAHRARAYLNETGFLPSATAPLGPASEVCAALGLWVHAVDMPVASLSLGTSVGSSVAIIGHERHPGRRRTRALRELGIHLMGGWGDLRETAWAHVPVEELLSTFVNAFLLPPAVLSYASTRAGLVRLFHEYRPSWSQLVATCRRAGIALDDLEPQRAPDVRELLAVTGTVPGVDMVPPAMASTWVQACARACAEGRITPARMDEMCRGGMNQWT